MNKVVTKRDLSQFNLVDIQRFLENENWKLLEKKNTSLLYLGPKTDTGEDITISLPSSEKNLDYYERIYDLINIFSAIKEADHLSIIHLISTTSNDILKMHVLNPGNFEFSRPLDIAAMEIDALKRLFMFSASSEEKPRPFFDKATTAGINHANLCQFGHTFEGSFGFTINSPIISDYSQLHLFEKETPFERRVMERIINGFKNIEESKKQKNIYSITENFEFGLNSRMCDAFLDLSIEQTKKIEFTIDWSYKLSPNENIVGIKKVLLDEESYEIIKEASDELKKIEPFEDTIIGPIITLHSKKEPFTEQDFPRTAIIKHMYKNKTINVKLELNREGFKVAYDAHSKGNTVKVKGRLFRKGTTWRMIDINDITHFYS